jgi:hypothetical protein
MSLLLAIAALQAKEALPLATFPEKAVAIDRWMKDGAWESKRGSPAAFTVGQGALHLVSRGDSVLIGTEKGFPLRTSDRPRLAVKLRVAAVPRGTDLASTGGDDAALRVYVGFDRGGGLLRPPNSIAYTWAEAGEADRLIESGHYSNLKYITVGSGVTADWVTVERDLEADYRRAFPKDRDVPALKGVLLKCDANNTESAAEAWVSMLELRPPPAK